MNILVCGDRNWTDYEMVERILLTYLDHCEIGKDDRSPLTIIEGGQTGADACAALFAERHPERVTHRPFPAEWTKYRKAAGPIRNQQMIDEGDPELVIAFHHSLDKSKGTRDMVKRARCANIPVRIEPSQQETN